MNIDNLAYEELLDLNRRIVERLKLFDYMQAHSEMMKFSVGERVKFNPRGREELIGILVKYNRKTVTVVTESGEKWNLSPRFLTKVENRNTKTIHSDNIIDIEEV